MFECVVGQVTGPLTIGDTASWWRVSRFRLYLRHHRVCCPLSSRVSCPLCLLECVCTCKQQRAIVSKHISLANGLRHLVEHKRVCADTDGHEGWRKQRHEPATALRITVLKRRQQTTPSLGVSERILFSQSALRPASS